MLKAVAGQCGASSQGKRQAPAPRPALQHCAAGIAHAFRSGFPTKASTRCLAWGGAAPRSELMAAGSSVHTSPAALQSPKWWPALGQGVHGEPLFQCAMSVSDKSVQDHRFEADVPKMLDRFKAIAAACESVGEGSCQEVAGLRIDCLLKGPAHSVWAAQTQDSPVAFACSRVDMDHELSIEALLWSIYAVEERLTWDRSSFVSYDIIQPARAEPACSALADLIYCRMPAPPGMSDREVVQERFLLRHHQDCYVILMRSPVAEHADAYSRHFSSKAAVRAHTILSGYMLVKRPGGGVAVTSMSQTDLGGNIPQWAQAMAKKASKKKPLEWAERLKNHCLQRAVEALARPVGLTGFPRAEQAVAPAAQNIASGLKTRASTQKEMRLVLSVIVVFLAFLAFFLKAPKHDLGLGRLISG